MGKGLIRASIAKETAKKYAPEISRQQSPSEIPPRLFITAGDILERCQRKPSRFGITRHQVDNLSAVLLVPPKIPSGFETLREALDHILTLDRRTQLPK